MLSFFLSFSLFVFPFYRCVLLILYALCIVCDLFCFCEFFFLLKQGVSNGNQATADTITSTAASPAKVPADRANWGNDIEFLMSCIAMSVGLGNIWRFPFIALENGGGAFLIPYLIVLLIIGRPLYYMEMILGQFSSRSSIKVYDLVPALRGLCECVIE